MNPALHCYTIPAGQPFLRTLAGWILEHCAQDAARFTGTLVLLPNRRACRGLREAFLDITAGKPLLLPRIRPIGEGGADEEEAIFEGKWQDIPPAISLIRRELLLAKLVADFLSKRDDRGGDCSPHIEMARQLARFIDEATREGISFDGLAKLVPEELAKHWQQTLNFLTIISQQWPNILAEEGVLDPVERRNRLLAATVAQWKKNPPAHHVIAAGSTGSQPATAALLAAVARLKLGRVILPGLDTAMPGSEWDVLSDTHPQFGMKQLLEIIGCKREEVCSLPMDFVIPAEAGILNDLQDPCLRRDDKAERTACLAAILQPPQATSGWTHAHPPLREGLSGMQLLTADMHADEARLIAVALREVLETRGKTAALVTPDRRLARMVVAQMQRFDIAIDDSAGRPLMNTPPATLLRLALDMVASQAAPAPLLALLRHPLTAAGREPAECRRLSRTLEMELLRGIRRKSGLDTLVSAAKDDEVKKLLADLAQHSHTLSECFLKTQATLSELLDAHIALAEWLAGPDALWAGEAGNQLAAFLAELRDQAVTPGPVEPHAYPGLFTALLNGQVWRPSYGLHPRLHILSPIEARLLHVDLVILGGMNEGIWPAPPVSDPWMSRPMRADFGLPDSTRSVGQGAHDIFLLSHAPEIIWSRARKSDGAPSVPSRWWVRLETLVGGHDEELLQRLHDQQRLERGKALLDAPLEMTKSQRPTPTPPLEVRPRKMRVTDIDTWIADPYVIYAKYILRLRALDPLDREPSAADFGTLVHAAMHSFVTQWPAALPDKPYEKLLACGREAFAPFENRPAVASLWWPRFEAISGWLIAREQERRGTLRQVLGEINGRMTVNVDGKPFLLSTRIDRLEISNDGSALIADYKTGTVPGATALNQGRANQLSLETLIVLRGALDAPVGTIGTIRDAEYWQLAGGDERSKIISAQGELDKSFDAWLEEARERLESLIRNYDHADTGYGAQENPALTLNYNDYEHLTRRGEWEAV